MIDGGMSAMVSIAVQHSALGTRDGLTQQVGANIVCIMLNPDRPVQVQKLTDGFIKDVDSMCDQKEAELQKV